MAEWTLEDAKSRFDDLVDAALEGSPQTVTHRGRPVVVVTAVEDCDRTCGTEKADTPNFIDHLLAIPNGGPDDLFDRHPLRLREVE